MRNGFYRFSSVNGTSFFFPPQILPFAAKYIRRENSFPFHVIVSLRVTRA